MARQSYILKKLPNGRFDLVERDKVAAWLEKQPADKSYDFKDPFRCAWYQFSGHVAFCSELDELGVLKIVARYPRTFGAALERARMALSGA